MDDEALTGALLALEREVDNPAAFCWPFLAMFPASGAAVSTVGDFLGSETVSASDALAARIDELQFDLGEGPCWDAMNTGRPVLQPDVRAQSRENWPAFSTAISEQRVTSLFAFPLLVGPLRIGAVDLYANDSLTLDANQSRQAGVMAAAVGRHVLRRALDGIGEEYEALGNSFSRRLIHNATGMVLAQLRISGDDARLIIQGHAFAESKSMMEIADDIVAGRLSFSHGSGGIRADGSP